MKKIFLSAFLTLLTVSIFAQEKGTVVIESVYSESLVNDMGENPTREVAVYLPPGYSDTDKRYPVVYFLHRFMNDHQMMN